MTLSAVSNTIIARNQVSQQKAGTATEQSEKNKNNLSSEGSLAGKKNDDTVSLSQTEKVAGSSVTLDMKNVDQVLPRTKTSILQDSRTAIAAQANINSKVAQEFLSEK